METIGSAAQGLASSVNRLTWGDVYNAAGQLWNRIKRNPPEHLYGIPRGGCLAALLVQTLAHRDGCKTMIILDEPVPGTLVIDDLVDSGATARPFALQGYSIETLYRKRGSPFDIAPGAVLAPGWLAFPWEQGPKEGTGAEDLVTRLLQWVGEDPTRDGLRETPKRVLKAWKDLTIGYGQDPAEILSKTFEQPHDELVVLRGIEFHSTCEHHLLPFYGTASVGYIPHRTVVGISKLARLVECYARRLQIQERMCSQIAKAIDENLAPLGVGVVVKAKHSCMGCRGVLKPDSDMITSVTTGALRTNPSARAEFLSLVNS